MIGYARGDPPLLNWLRLLLATGARPVAAMKMVPTQQYRPDYRLLDLHPVGDPLTKKRNLVVPVIPELAALLREHKGPWVLNGVSAHSVRRMWRRMVTDLGFGPEVVSKVVRHTVASHLEWLEADGTHIP